MKTMAVMRNLKNYLARKESEVFSLVCSPKFKRQGSAIIGEVLVLVVLIALAIIFKKGGMAYLESMWTEITNQTTAIFK